MKRSSLVFTSILLSLATALSTCAADSARVVKYSQTDIIPIRAKVRFTTLIVLPANEEILDFTVGDKDFWIVNGIRNLCYLHPAQTGIRSNMNLVTASGRVYSFLLSEITSQPDVDPDLKVFVEPREESTVGAVNGHVQFVRASEVEAYKQEAPKPPGVMSKHTQSLVIMGVAVLMVLIMWLTGNNKRPTAVTSPATTLPSVSPTDTGKLQEFKNTIQSEQLATRRPVAPPDATQQGWLNAPGVYGGPVPLNPSAYYPPPNGQFAGPMPSSPNPEPYQQPTATVEDAVKEEKKKRAYESLFASNVALTYRQGEEAQKFEGASAAPIPQEPQALPQLLPSTPQAFSADAVALRSLLPQSTPTSGPSKVAANPPMDSTPGKSNPSSLVRDDAKSDVQNQSQGKKYVLFEGTVIETVLMNRLDGSFAGPVMCLVSTDMYSHDRQHVLIPAGSKLLGEAQKVSAFGQDRLAVFFHRLIMPDGYSQSLDQFKGLDQQGATALHDKVNNHYAKIFGASLAVGILGGIAEVGTGTVFTAFAIDQARQGLGEGLAMSGERILDRFLNLMPTITIREGARVKIYLSNDLLLPDYASHTMSSDM